MDPSKALTAGSKKHRHGAGRTGLELLYACNVLRVEELVG